MDRYYKTALRTIWRHVNKSMPHPNDEAYIVDLFDALLQAQEAHPPCDEISDEIEKLGSGSPVAKELGKRVQQIFEVMEIYHDPHRIRSFHDPKQVFEFLDSQDS